MADTKEMSDLLPCPFCGEDQPKHDDTSWVRCSNCGTEGGWQSTPEDAIAAWNRRAPTPEAAALILAKEALAKIMLMNRLHGLTPDSGGRQVWHNGRCGAVAQAALDTINALEVK